jgi:hypothetical protein
VAYLVGGEPLAATCWAFLAVEATAWVGFLVLEEQHDRRVARPG